MLLIAIEREQAAQPVGVMRLEGELDQSNFMDVINHARELRAEGIGHVVLDLTQLSYMGSSGIFALRSVAIIMSGDEPPDPEGGWGAFHEMQDQSEEVARVRVLSPQPQVDRVLDRTGMKRYFQTFDDRAAAVGSF